ncbi:MAG: SDR family NAD(P)-dependent oxidoreductase [Clostridia bacterium]|nr:SDR family NAD(P)-dependent oxidoreductase [Clostridia bacterium]
MKTQTIVITGSGSGLGKMAAIALAKRGHLVYATTHYIEEANELNNYAAEYSLPMKAFKLDILLEKDRNKLKDMEFDILINNAAIGDSGSVSEINVDRFKNVFETNVFSNIKITQIAIQNFVKQKHGRIIFLSSLAGRITIPFLSPYTASKFAIEAFSISLRKELKKLDGINIQVCIIEPGAYATGFNKENNDKKYSWMKQHSYFKYKLEELHIQEEKKWNFIESKNFNSIVKKYIKAVEVKKVKKRYSAPFIQSFLIQLGRILGM